MYLPMNPNAPVTTSTLGPSRSVALKGLFDALKQPFLILYVIAVLQAGGQILEQLTFIGIERAGNDHAKGGQKITLSLFVQVWHTLTFDPQYRTRLRSSGHIERGDTLERGDLDGISKRSLGNVDWHLQRQIVARTLEQLVLTNVQYHIQIPWLPSHATCVTFTVQPERRAAVNARGYIHRQRPFFLFVPAAPALCTRMRDSSAFAIARGTGNHLDKLAE